jgi:Peptidase family M28
MVSQSVLNGRIYRAAFLPLLFALAIAGFSLADRPAPLTSNLAPDAFDGARASAALESLVARFPNRRPGSRGDDELAAAIASELRALGGTAGGGFSVLTSTVQAQTIVGRRTLSTVVARRPGTTGEPSIAILAHRDAAAAPARAELSATAVLLELARVFASSQTRRTIVLVSTSGGSGGNAGASDFARHAASWAGGPIDAAIVLGDLAAPARAPFLAPFSDAPASAPLLLQRTVAQAIAQQAGVAPRSPTLLERLAQLTFPFAVGEQAPLSAHGLPAVLVQAGGELPPSGNAPGSQARMEGLGRAVLSAVYALDGGPEIAAAGGAGGLQTSLPIERKLLPEWAIRLLVATLLLPPLLAAGDGLARLRRRRRMTSEPSLLRSLSWVASCGLPFLGSALVAIALGDLGALPAPRPPIASGALTLGGSALEALLMVVLVLVLAWLAWPAAIHRLGLAARPDGDAPGLALLLVLGSLALVVWAVNPFTALLLVPALHLWLALAEPAAPPARSPIGGRTPWLLALVALGVAPLALLSAFYAHRLGLGLGGVLHTALLLFAGGRIGIAGAVLWSLAGGCVAAALLLALARPPARLPGVGGPTDGAFEHEPTAVRGGWMSPKSHYAGPGSLGGTESALRR